MGSESRPGQPIGREGSRSTVLNRATAIEDSVVLDVVSPVRDDGIRGDNAYVRG